MGATVHVHYCMGKIADLSLLHKEEDRCKKCGMKKAERNKGCCKDDHKTFKANDHQQAKVTFDFSHQLIAITSQPDYYLSFEDSISICPEEINLANSPPSLWRTCPIYILNQDYRI